MAVSANASADVAGLVLAGGASHRFGRDKARYPMPDGRPMVAHVAATLARVAAPLYLSVRDSEDPPPLDHLAYLVTDPIPDAGPIAGLYAGLCASAAPWLLVVACDLPFVTETGLRMLLASRSPDVEAVVAIDPDGRMQPLCACYRGTVQAAVAENLDAGRYAMHALLDRLMVRTVPLPADELRNINRPADLG